MGFSRDCGRIVVKDGILKGILMGSRRDGCKDGNGR